jgi:hypothetical protein
MSAPVGLWVRLSLNQKASHFDVSPAFGTMNDAAKALATDRLAQIIMTDKENDKAQSRITADIRSYAFFRSDAAPVRLAEIRNRFRAK